MTRLVLAVPALLAVAALAGAVGEPQSARADQTSSPRDTLTVSGVGSVTATPDEAQFQFGVETRGDSAQAALAANASAMRKVLAVLRAAGARDLATQWVSLSPISRQEGTIDGYSASNSVPATIGVERAGSLVDAAVEAGANEVSGPTMSSADANRLYLDALGNAVADARTHAEALAKAAGRTLGPITAIAEAGSQPVNVYAPAALGAAASTPIEPGQQETTAGVTVTFVLG